MGIENKLEHQQHIEWVNTLIVSTNPLKNIVIHVSHHFHYLFDIKLPPMEMVTTPQTFSFIYVTNNFFFILTSKRNGQKSFSQSIAVALCVSIVTPRPTHQPLG